MSEFFIERYKMGKQLNYDDVIRVRVKKDDKALFYKKAAAAGKSGSEFLRQLIDKGVVKENKNTINELKKLTNEINRIGVNVNQIAKNNNSHFYTEYEKKKLFAMLKEINNALLELTERIY